jgi:hypothetical protein
MSIITVSGVVEEHAVDGKGAEEIIQAIVPKADNNIDNVLRELSASFLFTLKNFS